MLQRLLLREIAVPLAAALLIMVQLLVVLQLLQMNDLLLGAGLDAASVGRIFAYMTPHYAVFAVPPALLLGILLGFGRMAEDRELVAMAGLGRSPLACYPMPLVLASLLSALVALLALRGQPWGLQNIHHEVDRLVERNVLRGIEPEQFYEQVPGLMLHAGAIPRPGDWHSIMLDDESREYAPTLMTARRGRIEKTGLAGELALELEDGEMHMRAADGTYTRARFEKGTVPLSITAELSRRNGFNQPVRQLYPHQLLQLAADAEARGDLRLARVSRVVYHRRLAEGATCLVFALLAVPIASTGRRTRASAYVITLLAYLMFYAVQTIGLSLGETGFAPPAVAAWTANGLGLAVALLLGLRHMRAAPAGSI